MIAVLGAGPHGRQIAHDLHTDRLYDDWLEGYEACTFGAMHHKWIVGALWPEVRRAIVDKVSSEAVTPHHEGVVVFPHTYIGIDVELGSHVHVLPNAAVSHGCRLGDFVTVATGAQLCGEVNVGEGAFIGAGAVVIHGGIQIGAYAVIGAGVTVKHDVPAGETVRC